MKLLFFDIDGTLVSFSTHRIPQSAIDALRRAKELGHKVIISTGRPRMIINNLCPLQDTTIDGYITMNGSYCFVGSDVLYKGAIPPEDVEAIVEKAKSLGVPCIMVGD